MKKSTEQKEFHSVKFRDYHFESLEQIRKTLSERKGVKMNKVQTLDYIFETINKQLNS